MKTFHNPFQESPGEESPVTTKEIILGSCLVAIIFSFFFVIGQLIS